MGVRVESVMLAVLLILSSTVSDGTLIPKCQVAQMLKMTVTPNETNPECLVAKIVRHVELTSHFNTSAISLMTPLIFSQGRNARAVPNPEHTSPPVQSYNNALPKANKPNTTPPPKTTKPLTTPSPKASNQLTTPPPKTTKPLTTPSPKASNQLTTPPPKTTKPLSKSLINPTSETNLTQNVQAITQNMSQIREPRDVRTVKTQDNLEMWTAYGIFQIVDVIACISPNKSSFNVCNMTCDELIDDNFIDDITCLWTIFDFNMMNPVTQDEVNNLIETLTQSFMSTYSSVNYTQYLAECNGF